MLQQENEFSFFLKHLFFMCLHMWRSEDNLKLSLSSVVVSGDQDHVIRFAGKHLYVDLSSWSRDFVSWLECSVATFHLVVRVAVLP